MVLAGFGTTGNKSSADIDNSNYLNTKTRYWGFSPANLDALGAAGVSQIDSDSYINYSNVSYNFGVRPVISLKSGTVVEPTGEGTTINPYVVK